MYRKYGLQTSIYCLGPKLAALVLLLGSCIPRPLLATIGPDNLLRTPATSIDSLRHEPTTAVPSPATKAEQRFSFRLAITSSTNS